MEKLQRSFLARHWFALLTGFLLLLVIPPFLAPVFMALGWTAPARVIYFIYSLLCHQLPERSFFLFGSQFTHSLEDILQAARLSDPENIPALRQFIGSPLLGWKVAWSDRMVSMYTSIPLFALAWYPFRKKVRDLPLWGFLLLILPMALDGGSHFISDLSGLHAGFRADNAWLAALTRSSLPASFYAGDMWGSFNSIMRLVSGALFGAGAAWFSLPHLEESLS